MEGEKNCPLLTSSVTRTGAVSEVRYLADPFRGVTFDDFAVNAVRFNWHEMWYRPVNRCDHPLKVPCGPVP